MPVNGDIRVRNGQPEVWINNKWEPYGTPQGTYTKPTTSGQLHKSLKYQKLY